MKHHALSLLIAVTALSAPAVSAPAWAAVEQDQPSVETVLNNCVKAVGGRASLDKIKTLHTVMTMTSAGQPQPIDMDASWSRRGGRLMTAKTPMGDMLMGTDGTTTWMKTPMGGYTLAPENMKAQLKLAAMPMMMIDPTCIEKKDIEGVKVVGKESFQGKDCYKLTSPKTDGDKPSFMYFEVESGLPVGFAREDGKGNAVFGDWKRVDGVLFFHSMKMEGSGRDDPSGDLKVTKIEVNKPDEAAFALPEEVKKLSDRKKSDADAPEIRIEDLDKPEQKDAQKFRDSLPMMDKATLEKLQTQMGMGVDYMPENRKKLTKFYIQEVKKELAKRG